MALESAADTLIELEDPERSLIYARKALALRREHTPKNDPDLSHGFDTVARALIHLEREKEALDYLEQCLALDLADYPLMKARCEIQLAEMVWKLKGDADRARKHAESARGFFSLPDHEDEARLARLDRLLSEIADKTR
jgi:tetratricopeptide (TPR) repeat protein